MQGWEYKKKITLVKFNEPQSNEEAQVSTNCHCMQIFLHICMTLKDKQSDKPYKNKRNTALPHL
jgi:hypothetical protein